ncbi:MAG: hypothetical protein P0S95_04870 [Rhabdochlamydiaceae bacterium]|nr:hypothetical protein [Candidatus Amphrikana amoebophyrae]
MAAELCAMSATQNYLKEHPLVDDKANYEKIIDEVLKNIRIFYECSPLFVSSISRKRNIPYNFQQILEDSMQEEAEGVIDFLKSEPLINPGRLEFLQHILNRFVKNYLSKNPKNLISTINVVSPTRRAECDCLPPKLKRTYALRRGDMNHGSIGIAEKPTVNTSTFSSRSFKPVTRNPTGIREDDLDDISGACVTRIFAVPSIAEDYFGWEHIVKVEEVDGSDCDRPYI